MNKKSDKKSSIEVPRDQSFDFKQKLRGKDVLDLDLIATRLIKELRQLRSDHWTYVIVLCTSDNADIEQWLSLPDAGLLQPFTATRQVSSGDVSPLEIQKKNFSAIKTDSHINHLNPARHEFKNYRRWLRKNRNTLHLHGIESVGFPLLSYAGGCHEQRE